MTKAQPRAFTAQIHVVLYKTDDEIIKEATKLGRHWGRDNDWVPANLNDAIKEIVLWSDASADYGVEIQ